MPSKKSKKTTKADEVTLKELEEIAKSNGQKISILTVSQVKRIPFLHNLSRMIEYQTQTDIFEWVITNGSTTDQEFDEFNEKIKEVKCSVPIKHVSSKNLEFRNIGAFRNLANRNASGDIIVCMDDDDFYFKDYVKTCVDVLNKNKEYLTVGCSGMFMYDYGLDTVFRLAAFGPNHTVNCCMAYRKSYFNDHKYDESRKTGEELSFLDNYKSRMYQLPPTSAIVHMSYADNTFSGKRQNMLNSMYSAVVVPEKAPCIYYPIRTSLENMIKHDEIYKTYLENFEKINNQVSTDVTFYCGNQGREWNPEDNKLYVNERKCIEIGKILIKKGYSVSVYGKFDFNEKEISGIQFYNLKFWNVRRKTKYLILMDFFGFMPVCAYDRIFQKINAEKIFVDVQSNLYIYFKHISKEVANNVKFGMKNIYHIHMNPPGSADDLKYKIDDIILPNGIDLELFQKDYGVKRESKRFCYTSRFNNGLLEILKYAWPIVIKQHPDAEFHIYYGFESTNEEILKEVKELLLQDGVHYHGRVSHEEIAIEFQKSAFLYYFTATPGETDCISVMEALASGCIPIIWNRNIFSKMQGLVCDKPPTEVKSHQDLATKVCSLLTQDDDRERVSKSLRNSHCIVSNEIITDILIDSFNGDYITIEKLQQMHRPQQAQMPKPNYVPNIDLQNYVDSDSDSEVEYEPDSDEEESKDFIAAEEFSGSKNGYVYKNDTKGLGYYKV